MQNFIVACAVLVCANFDYNQINILQTTVMRMFHQIWNSINITIGMNTGIWSLDFEYIILSKKKYDFIDGLA